MKPALMMSLEGVWYGLHDKVWQASADLPVLSESCRILTDFDGAPAGVIAVDTKPEFAPSMIEKKVRSEGQVDGEAHILTHRMIYAGGSSRVLYTAVPVTSWNTLFTWLGDESSIGLVYSVEAAMLALANRYGAVMCRAGRQFRLLVSQPDRLNYVTTTAFSDDPDDLDIALISLMDRAGPKFLSSEEHLPVYWCDLLAADRDGGARLVDLFSQRMKVKVVTAPVKRFESKAGALRTAAESMFDALSWRGAVNPWRERISAAIDQFRTPVAAAVAVAGLGIFSIAAAWTTQALEMHARADRINQEANTISQRIAGQDIAPAQLLASYAPTITFLDSLARAAGSPDPLAVLEDVRRAADQRVRLMRIRLVSPDGVFRVDGVPLSGANTEVSISGFLAALNVSGYRVSAEDPGNQSQLPGFFSYSLRRSTDGGGAKR